MSFIGFYLLIIVLFRPTNTKRTIVTPYSSKLKEVYILE
jgi:hypothetical protein